MGRRGVRLVYGGGHTGMMGAVADGALEVGGEVVGVIPHALVEKELAHPGVKQMEAVNTMHERKARMAELSDGFLALPGGIGTLEELFEVYTWTQLRFHDKPVGVLNVAGYFDTLLRFCREMQERQFLREEHVEMLLVLDNVDDVLEKLNAWQPPEIGKWF